MFFYFVIQYLSPALTDIMEMCYHISKTHLCDMERMRTYTLQEFKDTQLDYLQKVQLQI